MQQVIESADIPNLSQSGYQVYQFPSRALLNPEKDASVLQDQEISIEPMRAVSPGEFSTVAGVAGGEEGGVGDWRLFLPNKSYFDSPPPTCNILAPSAHF